MSSGTIEYDWTQPEEKILVDMIRADNNNRPLTTDMITFGPPVQLVPTTDATWNTSVLVSATPVAPFRGSQTHRYHRVPIQNFVYENTTDLVFVLQEYPTLEAFVEEVSRRIEVNLTLDKVVFDYPTSAGTYTLTIAQHSLCYYGSIDVTFVDAITPLPEVVANNDLLGFFHD